MDSPTPRLQATVLDHVGTIAFDNQARRNAMTLDMWQGLPALLAAMDASEAVRVLVLRGAGGRAFCAGADISQFETERASKAEVAAYDEHVLACSRALAAVAKPVIALIEGPCVGGGLAIALGADLRIATDQSRFGIPAARLGVGYNADELRPLRDLVGPSFAKEIMITGRLFSAVEALAMGLVNRVLPVAAIDAYVADYTRTIAANAPLSIRAAKAAIDELGRDPAERDMQRCHDLVAACYDSSDYTEGRRAFMDKRAPVFSGR